MPAIDICRLIAEELGPPVKAQQVEAAMLLLDEGATVPFIARYRKEKTGGLDDVQLRLLEERLRYLRELEERRETILNSIKEQGKLSPELERQILAATTKTLLEDLYLPYKTKRQTKASKARDAGLLPLARRLIEEPTLEPLVEAAKFVAEDLGYPDAEAALEGAQQILLEHFSQDLEIIQGLREHIWNYARIRSTVAKGKEEEGARFRDYFEHEEPVSRIPSHRTLALLRGRKEGALRLSLALHPDDRHLGTDTTKAGLGAICRRFGLNDLERPADKWLIETAQLSFRTKLSVSLETEIMTKLRQEADAEAVSVFARNLRSLLLGAPAGKKAILGLDPGFRTGVKVAVVDLTGKVVAIDTIYPHPPQKRWDDSLRSLEKLVRAYDVELISIGNGTASRETDRLAADLCARIPEAKLQKVVTNEAGASVYSASELASKELPDLDVSIRGAASIARRLQDPLAELVKIDPKAIGVGQYQHDVNQSHLSQSLEAVVEDCVNAVGVDVNTASQALLARVAGLSAAQAENMVKFRDENGPFQDRQQILKVPRLGKKAYEQAAGFLRILDGRNPLDQSAVHPEAYPLVERMAKAGNTPVTSLVGNVAAAQALNADDFTDEQFGLPTVKDILSELAKPGRDPRGRFQTATFKEGVETMQDLKPGMMLEGVVTNVTNFGAFVDIGVHQDGLIHVSKLSQSFVKDPHEVAHPGQVVRVKVEEVDLPRKRIALTRMFGA